MTLPTVAVAFSHRLTKAQYAMLLGVREPPIFNDSGTATSIRSRYMKETGRRSGTIRVFDNLLRLRLIRCVNKRHYIRTAQGSLAMRRYIIHADRKAP